MKIITYFFQASREKSIFYSSLAGRRRLGQMEQYSFISNGGDW